MNRKRFEVEDAGLWHEVVRSVTPFGARSFRSVAAPQSALPRHEPLPPVAHAYRPPPPLGGFDRRSEQRMTRGQVEIDARIDLHGHGVELARHELLNFISARRVQGARLVLVITGKGSSPLASGHALHGRHSYHAPERSGRLRREVPLWLNEAPFRDHVVGYQQAHPKHGGGGALYVRLRRIR
jgi:DNA-nicking Smr family endonuclease